jgi:hypothetical protein
MKTFTKILLMGGILISNASDAQVANCDPPTAQLTIDINNVRFALRNGGDIWFDGSSAVYEIPKGSGNHSMFGGAIWLSAVDAGGNLLTAGQTYRQRGDDFWPGALANNGTIDSISCKFWDRIFFVTRQDIDEVKSGAAPNNRVKDWPGSHAPFFDANANGNYEPLEGEYPVYDPQVLINNPSAMAWWVMNDVGGVHTAYPGGMPLGLEIQATAFAYATNKSQILNNTTMYRYRFINKSNKAVLNFKMGVFADSDLGNGNDDYVGCDINGAKSVFYTYNATANDQVYGAYPPAIGITYLKTFKDEFGNQLPASSFMFFTNEGQPGINSDPRDYIEIDRYLNAKWADGQPLTFGTPSGRNGSTVTNFAFPGNLSDPNSWKESASPGDRRMISTVGNTSILPGGISEMVFAVAWAQSNIPGNIASVDKLILSTDSLHQYSSTHFAQFSTGLNLEKISAKVFPNPSTDKLYIEFENAYQNISFTIYSLDGKKIKTEEFVNSRITALNVSSLLNGIYVLKINADGAEKVMKFVKE